MLLSIKIYFFVIVIISAWLLRGYPLMYNAHCAT